MLVAFTALFCQVRKISVAKAALAVRLLGGIGILAMCAAAVSTELVLLAVAAVVASSDEMRLIQEIAIIETSVAFILTDPLSHKGTLCRKDSGARKFLGFLSKRAKPVRFPRWLQAAPDKQIDNIFATLHTLG